MLGVLSEAVLQVVKIFCWVGAATLWVPLLLRAGLAIGDWWTP